MNEQRTPVIRLKGITKRFGNKVLANDNISMDVLDGEVLALLGENGSGKTTLLNMLSGIYYPDSGEIYVRGRHVSIKSPHDAYALGICMIHQHFKLVDVFTATENVVLGLKEKGGFDLKAAAKRIRDICEEYGFDVDPDQKVYDMTVSQKQTLEIVKALYRGAEILILDEPTAVLTPQETEKLFSVIRNMQAAGKTIIIITHKLQEVLAISDRVAILRKGEYIATVKTSEATVASLTEMMVGKKVELNIDRPEVKDRSLRLKVSGLSCKNADNIEVLKNVSFEAYSGEILGIAGISGCGQKELLEAIAGLQHVEPGAEITYTHPSGETETLIGKSPKQIRKMGVSLSFVPEDRLGMGLVGGMGMVDNMLLKDYNRGSSPLTDKKPSKELAERIRDELGVVTPSISTPVRTLSGGNVQKVLVGRELASAPTVLMTAYAVRGLDINTSYVIYDLLNEQKQKGVAVIFVGEELDVLLALSDRILVLCGGHISGVLDARTATKEQVGYLMTNLPDAKEGGDADDSQEK
ncbi:MAG: ABC transporter ATP-binding protein [Clostridia bacterium]|nr:ABC transporter ATP-binding protein [Clostridia bacterium]